MLLSLVLIALRLLASASSRRHQMAILRCNPAGKLDQVDRDGAALAAKKRTSENGSLWSRIKLIGSSWSAYEKYSFRPPRSWFPRPSRLITSSAAFDAVLEMTVSEVRQAKAGRS